jgi:hypothetical protein
MLYVFMCALEKTKKDPRKEMKKKETHTNRKNIKNKMRKNV